MASLNFCKPSPVVFDMKTLPLMHGNPFLPNFLNSSESSDERCSRLFDCGSLSKCVPTTITWHFGARAWKKQVRFTLILRKYCFENNWYDPDNYTYSDNHRIDADVMRTREKVTNHIAAAHLKIMISGTFCCSVAKQLWQIYCSLDASNRAACRSALGVQLTDCHSS